MISRTEKQNAADPITQSYVDIETLLMQNIIRHVCAYDQLIDSDDWLMTVLAQLGVLNKENISIIAKAAGLSRTAVEKMCYEVADTVISRIEPGLSELERKGMVKNAVPVERSENLQRAVKSVYDQAADSLNVCNTTMLYKAQEAYKNVVQDITEKAKEIENKQEYLDILGKHAIADITGAESRQIAIRNVIKEFNEIGIPAFVDKKGRSWTPEAYVSMALRATAGNVSTEAMFARMDDRGLHLIEMSSHAGARPKCSKDQGKIFDRHNGKGTVEDLNGKQIEYYPLSSSSYGEPDGILGINCGHHGTPFIPGISRQRYFPTEDFEANDKLYKKMQKQRAFERDVRKQKRLCALYNEAGDKDAFEEASVRLKSKEAALGDYVKKNKLTRRKDREQVVGFDRSASTKAVAAKKRVDKYGTVRYNEDGTIIVTDNWKERGHASTPKIYKKNAIIETAEKKGDQTQINRTFYDSEGKMYRQTHSGPHKNPKQHPYGNNGEHAHDYKWENGKIVERTTRALTDDERKESGDIL